MRNNFTVIYTESWMSGSHRQTQTMMRRTEQLDGETVQDMLTREGIDDRAVFVFHGHPLMHGEDVFDKGLTNETI